jgi:hypothetical protein
MAKGTRCCKCQRHQSRMVFGAGKWWCGECFDRREREAHPVSGVKFLGLPSTERLRTGVVGLPPTNRSWTR